MFVRSWNESKMVDTIRLKMYDFYVAVWRNPETEIAGQYGVEQPCHGQFERFCVRAAHVVGLEQDARTQQEVRILPTEPG